MKNQEYQKLIDNYKSTVQYHVKNETLHTPEAQKHIKTLYKEIIKHSTNIT